MCILTCRCWQLTAPSTTQRRADLPLHLRRLQQQSLWGRQLRSQLRRPSCVLQSSPPASLCRSSQLLLLQLLVSCA